MPIGQQTDRTDEDENREKRTTLLVVRAKLREALALSLRRRR